MRRFRPGRLGRLLLAWTALVLVALAPGGLRGANAQLPEEDVEATKARMAEVYDPLEELHAGLDRTRFDLDEVSLELAFEDAPTIAARIHEAVRYEPYHGLMRGAEGTLASGGGNALDQALLATVLMWDAGYEAEIVRAELSEAGVDRILRTMRVDAPEPLWEAEDVPEGEGDPAALAGAVRDRVAGLERDAREAREALRGALPRGSDGAEAMQRVREAARDYFWVQYRWGPDEPWQDAHPVFGETVAEVADLEPRERFADSVPPELQHRLRVEAFVEQRMGDTLHVHPVMDAWERPVANLYGRAITYGNLPDGLEAADDPEDMAQVRDETNFFFPMLLDSMAPGAQAFEMNGNVTIPEAAQSPFGAIFQTVGEDVGQAAGALGNIGLGGDDEPADENDFVALTAHWVDFTLIRPGGEEIRHRRMITDRRGEAARAADDPRLRADVSEAEAFDAIAGTHVFMVEPGRYGGAFVADRGLGALLDSRELLDATLDAMAAGRTAPRPSESLVARQNAAGPLWLFDTFHGAPLDEDLVSYRPEPGLVVLSQTLDGERSEIDVVANPRWTFRIADDGPRFDPASTLGYGAWETRVEGLLLPDEAPATPAFAALRGTTGALRVAAPGDEAAVDALEAPDDARAAMREDVARGYAVIAPATMAADPALQGWWRVDPVTGETLGRGGDGRGQSFAEYLTTSELSWTITAGVTMYGVNECTKIEDASAAGCCIVENLAMAAGGMAIGAGVAATESLALGLIAFGALDVGVNTAGVAGVLPSFCGT